ncbi:hypothetical protein K525DRAFT_275763, partial [Schizophyllum commune Loenen D]
PLADAQEAVLAGLTDTYRDDRPGSHQNYDSALRDSWPDAKRASEGVQRAASGRGRANDPARADAKRPTPGRQDNPHASNAFKSVYSNVDSVYSQDDYTPSGARYTRNLDSIYSQDDDDQAYYADASGAAYADTSGTAYADTSGAAYGNASGAAYTPNEDLPTVLVSSPITSTSSRQASRQPIQQHIRNFSRPMPQPAAPMLPTPQETSLASPSTAFNRPESSYTAYSQDVAYNQDDSFAHEGPSANANGLTADTPTHARPTLTTTASSRAVVVTESISLPPGAAKPVRPYISTEHLEEQKRMCGESGEGRAARRVAEGQSE